MIPKHILVVDDDTRIRKLLHRYLNQNDFYVSEAAHPKKAKELMQHFIFDMLILDVMMPYQNGYDFAKQLREENNLVPIIMLTAMGDTQNRIEGLESGVDDYLAKPFEPKELLLRMANIFKRIDLLNHQKAMQSIWLGAFRYDMEYKRLFNHETQIDLTPAENDLLLQLALKAGKEVSRSELALLTNANNERTIDVQVNRLRRKLEENLKNPTYLKTVRGTGYILLPDLKENIQ